MGGERETTVAAAISKKGETQVGDIRLHESDGEVHFHADSSGLKVAVPSGIWFQAWMRLMDQGGSFTFVDTSRNTSLVLTIQVVADTGDTKAKPRIDAELLVGEIESGDAFKTLHEFTTRK